jgi:membrane fusion protein, epimerase transport system
LRAQIAQAGASIGHQRNELETNRSLQGDGFVSGTRISQLEAGVADYGVKLEEWRSELARAEQRRVEIELKLRSLDTDYRQQASEQLKVAASRLSEIEQGLRKSRDAAARQVIVAPVSGEVIGLKVSAPGAVIPPRETIADIVPADSRLVIEPHLRTEDVDRVRLGQPADIRFTAFKSRSTRLVEGTVLYVSGDRFVDRDNNVGYYTALIEADALSLQSAGDIGLVAGVPAEVFLKGEQRTPLQHLIEPITQVLRRAGREP